jgi:hypothetical protein
LAQIMIACATQRNDADDVDVRAEQGPILMLKVRNCTASAASNDREPFEACLRRLQERPSTNDGALTLTPHSAWQSAWAEHRANQDPPMTRPAAPFLMHLIATAQGAPQTRARRRADPDQAVATYAAAMRKPGSMRTGRGFSRSR